MTKVDDLLSDTSQELQKKKKKKKKKDKKEDDEMIVEEKAKKKKKDKKIDDLAEYASVTAADIRCAAGTIDRWKAFMPVVATGSDMPDDLAESLFALTDRLIKIEICNFENRVYCLLARIERPSA